jgi:hypothetical protein
MSLEVYPEIRKRARTVSGDSVCRFGLKVFKVLLHTTYLSEYRGNIGFKYPVFLFEKYSA